MDDEEWLPPPDKKDMDSPVPSTRSRRARRKINYFHEKHDTQFVDYPGLTHFERTRKGGDVRPRTVKKHTCCSVDTRTVKNT